MKIFNMSPGLFRFFLALIVVIHHCVDFLLIGHAAVFVFFILSGYWIAKMYKEKYANYIDSYKIFLISRIMRLMPVYYLILIISIVVAIIYRNLLTSPELNNPFFYLMNLFILGQKNADYLLVGTGWSLDIELQFYILAPLIFLILTRINYVVAICITIAMSILYYQIIGDEIICVISYLPFFIIGMLIYIKDYTFKSGTSTICLILLILFYGMQYLVPELKQIFLIDKHYTIAGFEYRELVNITLSILAIPYITINIRQESTGSWEKIFSSMSYVIYLLHYPLILVYSSYITGFNTAQKIPYLIIYFVSCMLFSYLISRYFDQYFEKKRSSYIKSFPIS